MARAWTVLVPLTALGAGLMFATSAATAQGTDLRADRRLEITELIARERDAVLRQETEAGKLREVVAAISEQAALDDSRVRAAAAEPALVLAAGLVPVTGPGLTVALDDAPRRDGRPALPGNPNDLVVHQQDVQAVVNALWAGGAEAMTLMGQRITSTSAVRCVGNTVILHGRVYSPPFVVEAVGDPDLLRDALDDDRGVAFFRTFVDRFGLGYDVSDQGELVLPAYEGPIELGNVELPRTVSTRSVPTGAS